MYHEKKLISWKIQKWIFHFRKKIIRIWIFSRIYLSLFSTLFMIPPLFSSGHRIRIKDYRLFLSLIFSIFFFQFPLFFVVVLLISRWRESFLYFFLFFSSSNVILSSEGKFDPKFQSMPQLTQMNKRKHFILLYHKVESQMNRNDDLITEIKPFSSSHSSPFSTDLVCHGTFDVRWLLHSSACRLTFAWPGRNLSKLSSRNLEEQRLTQLGGGESRERIAKRMSGNFFLFAFFTTDLCFWRPSQWFRWPVEF